MGLLVALNKEHGITVLMVTHEPDMAMYAHRMVHFIDGQIAKDIANPSPTMPDSANYTMIDTI
jgi:putative ABC transport system ATP-binding protein